MLNKKFVIFDFDGTIADTVPLMRTIAQNMAEDEKFGRITEEDWEWVRNHKLTELPEKFGIPFYKIPGLLIQSREKFKKLIFSVSPSKGIIDTIRKLKKKGFSCAILSSTNKETIQEFVLQHKLVDLFDFVHSELNLFGKDAALKSLMKQYRMNSEATVYIGDEIRDLEACQKIGLDCISVGWGLNSVQALQKYGAKWIVTKPQDIVKLLVNSD